MGFKKMSVDEWIKVQSNPRQRDTERHASKAKHLIKFHPTHDTVFAAQLPGGILVKLDGHTRAYLWESGALERPSCVQVMIYPVSGMAEAKEYYTHYDSRPALEDSMDQVSGALSEAGLKPVSGLIKYKANLSAFKKLDAANKSIYIKLSGWRREIELLDSIGYSKNAMHAGGVLGALVLLRLFQIEQVIRFLTSIKDDVGTKTKDGLDAVQMFKKIHDRKQEGHSEEVIYELAGKMIALFKGFVRGQRYAVCPQAVDVRELLADSK